MSLPIILLGYRVSNPFIRITTKDYDERITTIRVCEVYDGTFNREREPNQQQVQENQRILLVDDEHDVNLTISLILEENGFKVDSFTDAEKALENFTTGRYDLVILDVKMPGMSGFSLYREIRKLNDKVSVCFLTAADEVYYIILKKYHPNIDEKCIIHKPVDNESLVRQLKSVL